MRWTPTTSSESSRPNLYFRLIATAQTMPAMAPMISAPRVFTAPQDGVIATRPATTPDAAPSEVALPCRIRSTSSQPSIAAMVASVVFMNVTPVSPMNWSENEPQPSLLRADLGEDDRADVEAVPAEPQQARADHGQRQVVRLHRLLHEADPAPDDQGQDAAGDTGVDVHDRATGVVEVRRSACRTSRRPTRCGRSGSSSSVTQIGGKTIQEESFTRSAIGAGDQRRRDHREGELEEHVDVVRWW